MKILIITQYFPPDITAAAFRQGDTASLLVQAGHEVKVLAGEPHKGLAKGVDLTQLVDPKVDVIRCRIKALKDRGMRAYLGHYMSFVRSSISKGLGLRRKGWKPDVIFVSSPPLFVGLSGRFLAKVFFRPLVFEVRDIWPDSAVAAGQLSEDGRGYKMGRRMEKNFYRRAKHIVCVAKPMAEYIRQYCDTPITVIYNGIKTEHVPSADNQGPKPAKRSLLYAGNFGHVQNMDLIVEGFITACRNHVLDNWQLRLIGTGARLDQLQEIVAANDAAELVSIEPPVPREVVFEEMRRADALYLSLRKSFVLEHTIPSKVFDYLAMSRPVVAALAGEGREILESTGANLCFDPGDAEQLQVVLGKLNADVEALQQMAAGNRELVLSRFTREKAVEQLLEVFYQVTGGQPS